MFASNSAGVARLLVAISLLCQCSSSTPNSPTGGAGGDGGNEAEAGADGEGGTGTSGAPNGGKGGKGGSATAGTTGDAGKTNGGDASGSSSGGEGNAPSGGSAGDAGSGPSDFAFMLGADISSLPEYVDGGTTFVDTDGETKDLITILRGHGFNYVRLRTFVDPNALYGYANPNGDEQYKKSESYCDTAHTLEVARQAKEAGMGFLLDLHYSDNWADPGKQVIPEAWRGATNLAELADHVEAYTTSVVEDLIAGGARPDMVQIGNEITPGLLIHVPSQNPQADQWGNMNKLPGAVNGSTANFNNVATLLKAGVSGVKAADPTIKIMLHLENTKSFPAVRDWVNAVRSRGVELDVLGLSCYTTYQGTPEVWKDTFEKLSEQLDDLSFVIAEYNPEATQANQIMANLADGRGVGTFFWEPTQSGSWGASMFTQNEGVLHAKADRFAEFDALKVSLGL